MKTSSRKHSETSVNRKKKGFIKQGIFQLSLIRYEERENMGKDDIDVMALMEEDPKKKKKKKKKKKVAK